MSTLSQLYARNKAQLDSSERATVEEFIRREKARASFAAPDDLTPLETQTGFILFEREFCSTPVHLFGQDVASLAHTMIRVFRAATDEQGDAVPGEEIYAARISEKALTETVLLSNRGEGHPTTVTRLGGFVLPPRKAQDTRSERMIAEEQAKRDRAAAAAISKLQELINSDLQRPNSELKSAASDLHIHVRNLLASEYDLERHLEEMAALRSQVLTEAAHAALHAHKVAEALGQGPLALPPAQAPDWDAIAAEHPMVDFALDPLPAHYREILRKMMLAEITAMSQHHPRLLGWIGERDGHAHISFPNDQQRGSALANVPSAKEDREWIDSLQQLWNWGFNPSVDQGRRLRSPDQGAIAVSGRSGWLGDIHSTLPPAEGAFFAIRLSPGWEELDAASNFVRSSRMASIELEIVAEDLMTALRGHPEGLPVPCSLRTICGVWNPVARRPQHAVKNDIVATSRAIEATPEVAEVRAALGRLKDLVETKRSGKAWRDELDAALSEFVAAFERARGRVDGDLEEGREMLNAHVRRSAEDILLSISRSLPAEALRVLRIGKE